MNKKWLIVLISLNLILGLIILFQIDELYERLGDIYELLDERGLKLSNEDVRQVRTWFSEIYKYGAVGLLIVAVQLIILSKNAAAIFRKLPDSPQ